MTVRIVTTGVLVGLALIASASASPSPEAAVANGRLAFNVDDAILMNPDGTGAWPLRQNDDNFYPGDWSPDGKHLVVSKHTSAYGSDLYLLDASGQRVVRLTNTPTIGEYDASFSPDGSLIAYESFSESRQPQIWTMKTDGTAQRFLAASSPALDPEWSPDGKQIAWTSYVGEGSPDVWVMSTDGYDGWDRRRLTHSAGIDQNPSWSPDGTRIAFDSDRSGNLDVYTMKVDGTDIRRLTTSPALDAIPTWSPDGKRIAFVSERAGGRAIYVMDASGAHQTRVSNRISPGSGPTWQPIPPRPLRESAGGARCTIWGTSGDDLLVGGPGRDVICGLGGNDRILGRGRHDVLEGGPGTDQLVGGPGDDLVIGGPGDDLIDVRDGERDTVSGGLGHDVALVDPMLDTRAEVERARDPAPGSLSRGRPVSASSVDPVGPAELAVDGDLSSYWLSGAEGAWIQVDLRRPTAIARLRLVVAQWDGPDRSWYVVRGRGSSGPWRRLASFDRVTQDREVLTYTPGRPWRDIRWLRVVTEESPSLVAWREVEVYAP